MALFWCVALLCLGSTFAQPTTSEQWVSYNDLVRQSVRHLQLIMNKLDNLESMVRRLSGGVGPGGQTQQPTPTPAPTFHVPTTFLPDSTIRLVGGEAGRTGRLEVMRQGSWGTVCDDGFGGAEATVVCKSLGFSFGVMVSNSVYGAGTGSILLDDVDCSPSATRLSECSHRGWGNHNCGHSEDVGVECYQGPCGSKLNYVDSVDRDLSSRGQQYLCEVTTDDPAELQRSTCSDLIADLPGDFNTASSLLAAGGQFGCWMSTRDAADPGRLGACQPNYQQTSTLSSCSRCTRMFVCIDYPGVEMMRLAGGNTSSEGRVEVFHDGYWGTICNQNYGLVDALVICRSYGYDMALPMSASQYGTGTGPVWLTNLRCAGNESDLFDCPNDGWAQVTCRHTQDIAVKCEHGPCGSRMHYLGRVADAQRRSDGFDDMCYISTDSDRELANVQCSDLLVDLMGGRENSAALIAAGGSFGCWRGSIGLNDPGREGACRAGYQNTGRLSDCASCNVFFICINYPTSPTIRLVGGPTTSSGRVEIQHGGSWGTVCDDSFLDVDATVACRSLGYHYGIHRYSSAFGQGTGTILLDDLACNGDEARLEDCGHRGWGSHNCGHSEDVGVECQTIVPT